ncbi:MAG: hypothetical protein M3R15_17050 [Acidobacteriota bacterium]|nr:hypothetical protein [Acidobacteriota bacterium]
MRAPSILKKDWVITQEAFDKLLACLDADREHAGAKYEQLRRTLMIYLKFWGSPRPDEHADEALTRAARKIDEGLQLNRDNYTGYFCRIARNVLHEYEKHARKEFISIDNLPRADRPSNNPLEAQTRHLERMELERKRNCLQSCLRTLSIEERNLIESYYRGVGRKKIENRNALAERMGLTLNALRIRATRVRGRLEDCAKRCLDDERRV